MKSSFKLLSIELNRELTPHHFGWQGFKVQVDKWPSSQLPLSCDLILLIPSDACQYTLEHAYDLCMMQDHFLFSHKYPGLRKIPIYLALFHFLRNHWKISSNNIFPIFIISIFQTYKPFAKIVQRILYSLHSVSPSVNILTILINVNSHRSIIKIRKLI